MSTRWIVLACITLLVSFAPALADESAAIKGTVAPTASETAFIKTMQRDLNNRFATIAAAQAAGFFRYTNEDNTGAISYANLHWVSSDVHHPSQLWYDKDGHLLGADYSILDTGAKRPNLWGIGPGRWSEFDEHIHYVTKNSAIGAFGYDKYVDPVSGYIAAGGDPKHPSAAILVKMHRVASAKEVVRIFDFPHIWDLTVWVKPNPSGAFADKNPLVRP